MYNIYTMVNLIDIEAKDEKDTTPDPLMGMIFFFIASSIYCVIGIFLNDSQQRLIAKVCYLVFVVTGEYFINLTLSKQICGLVQWQSTLFVTVVPWILIFGVLQIFTSVFQGWNAPFSNTFGYLVTKLMGLPDVMKKILFDPDDREEKKGQPPTAEAIRALESIKSDNSLFINELYTEKRIPKLAEADQDGKLPINPETNRPEQREVDPTKLGTPGYYTTAFKIQGKPVFERPKFDQAWEKLEKGQIVKKYKDLNERETMKDRLYHFVQMKYTIAEYVWNLLTGFLVVSISYNYILNTGCAKSPDEMKERYDQYEEDQNKKVHNKQKTADEQPEYTQL